VQAHGHVLGVRDVAVDESGVLFAVAVVPECDHLEQAESRRQIGDRGDLDADPVFPEALAVVVAVLVEQFLDLHRGERHCRLL
jgi:hypothetical protein